MSAQHQHTYKWTMNLFFVYVRILMLFAWTSLYFCSSGIYSGIKAINENFASLYCSNGLSSFEKAVDLRTLTWWFDYIEPWEHFDMELHYFRECGSTAPHSYSGGLYTFIPGDPGLWSWWPRLPQSVPLYSQCFSLEIIQAVCAVECLCQQWVNLKVAEFTTCKVFCCSYFCTYNACAHGLLFC